MRIHKQYITVGKLTYSPDDKITQIIKKVYTQDKQLPHWTKHDIDETQTSQDNTEQCSPKRNSVCIIILKVCSGSLKNVSKRVNCMLHEMKKLYTFWTEGTHRHHVTTGQH